MYIATCDANCPEAGGLENIAAVTAVDDEIYLKELYQRHHVEPYNQVLIGKVPYAPHIPHPLY